MFGETLTCLIESRKSSPYEIGLGWTVNLDRDPFNGQAALRAEKARGSTWSLVGLELDWDEYEALFAEFDLPPQVPHTAWRDAVPVYDARGRQVGQATSGAWSPRIPCIDMPSWVWPWRWFSSPGPRQREDFTADGPRLPAAGYFRGLGGSVNQIIVCKTRRC